MLTIVGSQGAAEQPDLRGAPCRSSLNASSPSEVSEPTTGVTRRRVVRVLIADDHRIVRAGLVRLLSTRPEIDIVGEAADGVEAIELAKRLDPDVVLMDVTMPRLNGIDATRALHKQVPGVRIIGLSMHDSREIAEAMTQAGAAMFLTKGGPPQVVIDAILSGN